MRSDPSLDSQFVLVVGARATSFGRSLLLEDRFPVVADEQVEAGTLDLELATARRHEQSAAFLDVLRRDALADQTADAAAAAEDRKHHRLLSLLDVRLALEEHLPQRFLGGIVALDPEHREGDLQRWSASRQFVFGLIGQLRQLQLRRQS